MTMFPPGISIALILELNYDTLVAAAGEADVVVREYPQRYPEAEAAVIRLFHAAQQRGVHREDQLRQRITRGRVGDLSLCPGLLTVRIDA
jgi:hypothetical protein